MTSSNSKNSPDGQRKNVAPGTTINLQGVASFASLVELLANELGTAAGRMHGNLPSGPSTFNELVGEIDKNGQGFFRRLTLYTRPNEAITLRFQVAWNDGRSETEESMANGVAADYYLGVTVEQVLPQGRALARYSEEIFSVMERMVTLGQGNRVPGMPITDVDLATFEAQNGSALLGPSKSTE